MATVEEFKVKVNVDGANKLDQLASASDAVRTKMAGLAGAILGVGFGAFVLGAARSADAMADLSDATDLTIGTIIGFGSALEQAGGKSKNAEKTILAFYNAIEVAADGGLKQQKAFEKLGISLDDLRTMSEADIMNKTITGLADMTAGSERSAVAATLLGKSFRSVAPEKFAQTLAEVKTRSDEAAVGTQTLADFNQQLETTFRDLQLAAAEVIGPVLSLFEGVAVSSGAAKTAVAGFGIATALIFGAAVLNSIGAFISAYKEISKVIKSAVVAQTALTALAGPAGWAIIAGAAVAATAAYIALDKAMGDAAETADKNPAIAPGGEKGGVVSKTNGPVKRDVTKAYSEEEKAIIESRKRIAQTLTEIDKNRSLTTMNDIRNIEVNKEADIAKAKETIYGQLHLSKGAMDEEFAAKRVELETKAEYDIAKVRADIDKQLAEQLLSIRRTTEEKQAQFTLEQQMSGMTGAAAEKAKAILDIEKDRRKTLDDIAKMKNLDPARAQAAIDAANQEYDAQKALAESQVDWQRSFSTGWEKSFNSYVDNATNAAKVAESMFSVMTSNMNGAIDNFVETGKFSFSDFTNSILKDILKIQLKSAVAGLFGGIGTAGSAGTGLFGALGGLFRANGGPVSSGSPYIVGEKGPELFMPASSGTIIPNNKLSSNESAMGTVVNYNISAVDSSSFKQMVARDPSFLYAVTEQGRRGVPQTRR